MSRFGKSAGAPEKGSHSHPRQGQGERDDSKQDDGETLKRFRLGVGKRKVEFSNDCFVAGSGGSTLPNGATTDATTTSGSGSASASCIKQNHVPIPNPRVVAAGAGACADAAGNEKNNSEDGFMSMSSLSSTKSPSSRTSSFIRKNTKQPPSSDLIECGIPGTNHNSSSPHACYCTTEFQLTDETHETAAEHLHQSHSDFHHEHRDPWNKCEQLLLETCGGSNSSDGDGSNSNSGTGGGLGGGAASGIFLGIGNVQGRFNGGGGGSGGISSSEATTTDDDITPHSVISNLLRAPPPHGGSRSHSFTHTLQTFNAITNNSNANVNSGSNQQQQQQQPFSLSTFFDPSTFSYELTHTQGPDGQDECDTISVVQKSIQEMSNTEWILSQQQQRQYGHVHGGHANNPQDLSRASYGHAHAHGTNDGPAPASATNMTSTFGTILRSSTLASQHQQQQQQQQQKGSGTSTSTSSGKQKQWEAELDLIVPVGELTGLGTATTTGTSSSTQSQQQQQQQPLTTIHHSSADPHGQTLRNKVPLTQVTDAGPGPGLGPGLVPNHHPLQQNHRSIIKLPNETSSHTQSHTHNSRIILIPESSSFVPESRTGSSVRLSQSQQLDGESQPGGGGGGGKSPARRKRRFFCDGFELDLRQVCVVCGFLIVAAALGVGVGVPIALELRGHTRGGSGAVQPDAVRKLLTEVPLIDGHNDLAWNLRKFLQNQLLEVNFDNDLRQFEPFAGSVWSHTDLKRLREGGVGAQLWSAYVPCSAQHLDAVQIAVEQIDVIKRLVDKYKDSFSLVTSVSDVERAHNQHKISSLIAVEGGHAIGNSLAILRMLYNLGARSLTLTHNCNTPWADSASSDHYLPDRGGLTEFGKLVVLESNRLGLIVDLAHVSVHTMRDALAVSRAPVIFSHSAASALCNHSRNVPDEILRLVTANGGLVMVSFYNVFIACNETASIEDVIAHIEHIREVAGVDHVGIGAGYDGINFVPTGLEDVSKYPNLLEALLGRPSWSELDLKKLIGFNFLRVFRQVEVVRDDWRKAGVSPIEEWIPKSELEGHPTLCSYRGAT